jgi:urease accessory protein
MDKTAVSSAVKLWQLISPVLPVGAYSYSQGLEYAVERGWVSSEVDALDWIRGQLLQSQAAMDVPVLNRLHKTCMQNNYDDFCFWNRFLLAARETGELLYEDRQMGQALAKLLQSLAVSLPADWQVLPEKLSFAGVFALAAAGWQVDARQTALGYLWSWCENQVMAAVKLIPLGQTAGQRMLIELGECLPVAVEKGFELEDSEIGQMNMGFALSSALHETQYTRLFRS